MNLMMTMRKLNRSLGHSHKIKLFPGKDVKFAFMIIAMFCLTVATIIIVPIVCFNSQKAQFENKNNIDFHLGRLVVEPKFTCLLCKVEIIITNHMHV